MQERAKGRWQRKILNAQPCHRPRESARLSRSEAQRFPKNLFNGYLMCLGVLKGYSITWRTWDELLIFTYQIRQIFKEELLTLRKIILWGNRKQPVQLVHHFLPTIYYNASTFTSTPSTKNLLCPFPDCHTTISNIHFLEKVI